MNNNVTQKRLKAIVFNCLNKSDLIIQRSVLNGKSSRRKTQLIQAEDYCS